MSKERNAVRFFADYGQQKHVDSASEAHLDAMHEEGGTPSFVDRKVIARNYSPEHQLKAMNSFGKQSHRIAGSILESGVEIHPTVIHHISENYPENNWLIVRHASATTDVLEKLSHSDDEEILTGVAEHKNTPDSAVERLASHPNVAVRTATLYRAKPITKHLLDKLADDENFNTAYTAQRVREKNYVSESLDSTVRMDKVPEGSMLHSMGAMSASMVGGENFQMHQLGDGHGYLIQFDKNGATEVHHVDKNLQGGMVTNQQPAFKFVSTFKKHIQGLLGSGKTVRLVAHHAISAPLRKITDRMIDKNPGYSQSAVSDAEHEITGDKMHAWTLRKGV